MGLLIDFDLGQLIAKYGCRTFVETGTGKGAGIEYAAKCDFDHLYSIEIVHGLALEVALRFAKDHRITIIHGKSERGLKEALEEVPAADSVLFWLDARFPGADYGLKPYDAEKNESLRLPVQSELRVLAGLRDLSRDVILINELRLYEDGDYEAGPAPADRRPSPALRNLNIVDELLGGTHRIERRYRQSGCLCAYPEL